MAAPTDPIPDWATDTGRREAPSETREDIGSQEGKTLPALQFNGVVGPLSDWTQYMAQHFPTDDELDIGRITGVGDPGGSGNGLFVTTDANDTKITSAADVVIEPSVGGTVNITVSPSGGDILIDNNTGTAGMSLDGSGLDIFTGSEILSIYHSGAFGIAIYADGGANGTPRIDFSASTGEVKSTALVAAESTDTGKRYGYPAADPLNIEIAVSPICGSYVLMATTNGLGLEFTLDATGRDEIGMQIDAGASASRVVFARMALTEIVGNAETDARSTVVYKAVSLESSWDTNNTNTTELHLVERVKSTGLTSNILTVSRSSEDHVPATPLDLDPVLNEYFMEFRDTLNPASATASDGIETATLTLRKYAVE